MKIDAAPPSFKDALKVAELAIQTEELRARLGTMLAADTPGDKDPVRSLATLINAVTRLEGTARRAAADLKSAAPAKPTGSALLQQYLDAKHAKQQQGPKHAQK